MEEQRDQTDFDLHSLLYAATEAGTLAASVVSKGLVKIHVC